MLSGGKAGEPKCRHSEARRQGHDWTRYLLQGGGKWDAGLRKLRLIAGKLGLGLVADRSRGLGQGSRAVEMRDRRQSRRDCGVLETGTGASADEMSRGYDLAGLSISKGLDYGIGCSRGALL